MQYNKIIEHIVTWLKSYAENAHSKGFIIGISGGIDSAVTSYLCAKTGLDVICVEMGIHQNPNEVNRGLDHISALEDKFPNVSHHRINLTDTFESLKTVLPSNAQNHGLSMANTRARIRMTTLYAVGQANGLLVAGTGNKVEDFGVGFYTKYGDGGVDLSPIADLTKTDVFAIAKELNVIDSIQNAAPTDGLWEDERTDEGQIGATYPELEWAMAFNENEFALEENLSKRQREVLAIYRKFNRANKHKMIPIPVCVIPENLK
ncbi:NAD(+) synthase [Crocinitomix catalasitica]|uniref:NAD(+) synthase n=1 Tax=Crocinitomix catalasitica TaxID=184607 RepID=UPI00048669C8|nr:NAD(+) synthase [Crocinitomix catalasitica]